MEARQLKRLIEAMVDLGTTISTEGRALDLKAACSFNPVKRQANDRTIR